jgi:hypothetical protein
MTWQPTAVIRLIKNDIPTSTSPCFVDTDMGRGYVKMPNTSAGSQALVSELVGTQLAEWFGLQVFANAVIPVSEADINPDSQDDKLVPAFITREENGIPWEGGEKVLKDVENVRDFSWIVVFDTWVGNVDRHCWVTRSGERQEWENKQNVFLSDDAPKGQFTLKAYDHTHCKLSQIVASPQVDLEGRIKDPELYGCFPEFKRFLCRSEVKAAVGRLLLIDEATAKLIVAKIPDEWIEDDSARDRLVEFIKRRSEFVGVHIESMLFPQGELF